MFALWFHKVSVTFGCMFVDLTGISWSEHCFGLKSGKTVSLKGYSSVLDLIFISHIYHEQEFLCSEKQKKLLTTRKLKTLLGVLVQENNP